MPDGGYPMHFMTIIEGADLALMVSGTNITIVRLSEPTNPARARYRITKLGAFTEDQVHALVYHLAYWGGLHEEPNPTSRRSTYQQHEHGHGHHAHPTRTLMFNGRPCQPRFRTKGCIYDY